MTASIDGCRDVLGRAAVRESRHSNLHKWQSVAPDPHDSHKIQFPLFQQHPYLLGAVWRLAARSPALRAQYTGVPRSFLTTPERHMSAELPPFAFATERYADAHEHWPRDGKHVLAQFDDHSVIVYQAFNPEYDPPCTDCLQGAGRARWSIADKVCPRKRHRRTNCLCLCRIAAFAVEHGKFTGAHGYVPRMTWVKPGFLWMCVPPMAVCGAVREQC